MADRTPSQTKNLDRYGFAELPWTRPHELLAAGPADARNTFTLSTSHPGGRPHATGVGVRWHDGDLYFNSGPGTRKAKNLAADPAAVLSVSLPGLDLVLEGEATKVTEPKVMETVAAKFREVGWPVEVKAPHRAIQRPERRTEPVGLLSLQVPDRVRRRHRGTVRRDSVALPLKPISSALADIHKVGGVAGQSSPNNGSDDGRRAKAIRRPPPSVARGS